MVVKKLATLEANHVRAVFRVARLIDTGASADAIAQARAECDTARDAIRAIVPDYDRGYR